jgi:hypothetical protein
MKYYWLECINYINELRLKVQVKVIRFWEKENWRDIGIK